MREDSRRVQRVINALGRLNAVKACGPADGRSLSTRHSQPRKLWCLNPKTARKVLIIKDSKIETAEVGSECWWSRRPGMRSRLRRSGPRRDRVEAYQVTVNKY